MNRLLMLYESENNDPIDIGILKDKEEYAAAVLEGFDKSVFNDAFKKEIGDNPRAPIVDLFRAFESVDNYALITGDSKNGFQTNLKTDTFDIEIGTAFCLSTLPNARTNISISWKSEKEIIADLQSAAFRERETSLDFEKEPKSEEKPYDTETFRFNKRGFLESHSRPGISEYYAFFESDGKNLAVPMWEAGILGERKAEADAFRNANNGFTDPRVNMEPAKFVGKDNGEIEVDDLEEHDLASMAVYLDKNFGEIEQIYALSAEPDYTGENDQEFYLEAEVNGKIIPMPHEVLAVGAGELYESIEVESELVENIDKVASNVAYMGNPHSNKDKKGFGSEQQDIRYIH